MEFSMAAADQDHSIAASPAQFAESPFSRVIRQPLILGLFLPVQSGGWSASLLPRTTDWTFDYRLQCGIDPASGGAGVRLLLRSKEGVPSARASTTTCNRAERRQAGGAGSARGSAVGVDETPGAGELAAVVTAHTGVR